MRSVRMMKMTMVVGMAALLGMGCSKLGMGGGSKGETQLPLLVSENLPAAQGSVKVRPGKDGNNIVEVKVEHLAPAEKISERATDYVVWIQPKGTGAGEPQNLGVLSLDKDLTGTLKTITPYQEFDMFVTAESDPQSTRPTQKRVMRASVDMPNRTVR
jgi:hypothetical protein